MSTIKVTGQALAAVTTAGVGAYLGGAVGTVSGAAIASVVTTIGDAVYQRSIERTRDTIRARLRPGRQDGPAEDAGPAPTAVVGADPGARTALVRPPDANVAPPTVAAAPPTVASGAAGHQRPPEPDDTPTRVLSVGEASPTRVAPTHQPGDRAGEQATELVTRQVDAGAPETPALAKPSPWKRYGVLAATGLLVFLVAMVAITGVERIKGSPLSGGGPGTSVGSVLGHATPVSTTSAAPEGTERSTTSEAPTTTSGAEAPAPTTTSKARNRTTTTSERLVPTGLVPGG